MKPQDQPKLHRPKAEHLGVSIYPQHFRLLDELRAQYGGISRSRLVQYLIESAAARANLNDNDNGDSHA